MLLAGLAAMVTAGPIAIAGAGGDVDTLEKLWPGVRDSTEQVYVSSDPNVAAWGEGSERRVRTIIAPVEAPWLGQHVLYLEEFLHDDPESIRRQLLLDLQPAEPPAVGVRVRLYSFKEPRRWIHLDRRPKLLSDLRRIEIVKAEGCDLMLKKEGDQYSGGTVGRDCIDIRDGGLRYVEYRVVIGEDLYWYRRRVLLRKGDDLQEEVFGFNWFELNDARLFACRVDWSATGRKSDLRFLARLEVHDQGGRAHFTTPDGRKLELTLHSQDWPFMVDRDALILLLQDEVQNTPMASAWAEIDSDDIDINLGWLWVQCGSMVPETGELWARR
ncbi:MAG: CpcT/CpeT family chromophore lyase [Steroidobacteraceae bacterium]